MKTDFYVYVWRRAGGVPCYVGKGRGRRWRQHGPNGGNPWLAKIFAKEAEEMRVEFVATGLTESDAFALERELIAKYGRRKTGGTLVNMTDGGEGTAGREFKHSCRSKKRMSVSQRKRFENAIEREKISAATREAMQRPEVRERYLEVRKLIAARPEFREKISLATKGRKLTAEHKAKIGAGNRGKKVTEETRAKMSAWQIGRKMSKDARQKMSDAAKRRFSNPEQREVASRAGKLGAAQRWHPTPEVRT
jgi:hypothetical protein